MEDAATNTRPMKIAHLDATTGPTDWAGRSIELERRMGMEGHAPAPPRETRRPGNASVDAVTQATDAVTGATSRVEDAQLKDALDAATSATVDVATPATASADDLFSADASPAAESIDAATGATPGVAAACKELGMSALEDVVAEYGIKPPGQL